MKTIIVNRRSTGCKQYIFESYRDMVIFFTKPCYADEKFIITEFNADGAYTRKFVTSQQDFIYGCGVQLDLFRSVNGLS